VVAFLFIIFVLSETSIKVFNRIKTYVFCGLPEAQQNIEKYVCSLRGKTGNLDLLYTISKKDGTNSA
jgi:hypothetical protein